MRTPYDIATRINQLADSADDPGCHRRDIMMQALPYEYAEPWVRQRYDRHGWDDLRCHDMGKLLVACLALGASALLRHDRRDADIALVRVDACLWVLGMDDALAAMAAAPYPMMGAPKLLTARQACGGPVLAPLYDHPHSPDVQRMAQGQPCRPACPQCTGEQTA